MTQAAVLTGDLVGSTEAGPEATDRAIEKLERVANIFTRHQQVEPMRFTRSRGDGWQMIVQPAHKYFRATAFILAALRHADIGVQTRIGIGIGAVISYGSDNLADAHGTAFVQSGHALDQIGQQDRLAILGLSTKDTSWCRAALETLSYLSSRWSVEQAAAIAGRVANDGIPLFKMAQNLDISRQALSSRLAVAGEKPIMAAIRAAEETL